MKIIKQGLLVLLSTLPIRSVAIAANSALNELEGELQTIGLKDWRQSRMVVMPIGVQDITLENAWYYYSTLNKGSGIEPNQIEFENHLKTLLDEGIIEMNELMIRSHTPSIY